MVEIHFLVPLVGLVVVAVEEEEGVLVVLMVGLEIPPPQIRVKEVMAEEVAEQLLIEVAAVAAGPEELVVMEQVRRVEMVE